MEEARQYTYTSPDLPTTAENTNAIVQKALKLTPAGNHRVLEIGCGNGWFSRILLELGHSVVAVDTSQSGIAIAKKQYPGIKFEVASAYDKFSKICSRVDVIYSLEVIEHLERPAKMLENAFAALRPGGVIILSTPYHGYWKNLALSLFNKWDHHHGSDWEGGHVKFFSVETLSGMMRAAGFEEITFEGAGRVPGLWKSMVLRGVKNG